eukprot:TRINITY_DN439_c0_g1_i2.p1 TRINITY_DN439_c0_g1~~TRINITY_DN439_c0_g1_i2.p1  ORF type:complete len:414 (-),score=81.56 TRINITY_DN439_c0_g1_i2:37-1278(-)
MLSAEHQIQGMSSNFFSLQTVNTPPLLPPIQLLKQTSSSQERISINGLQKSVHVVVKNAPFLVQIALTSQHFMNQMVNLNNFTFDAVLLYDSDSQQEKFVDYVKVKPVDHKPTVNETGDQVTMELRIKVLTSQHENSFFRVKIFLLDPNTGTPFHPSLVVFSEPVKVISKPEQVKKRSSPSASQVTTNVSNPTVTSPTTNASKKRNVNDLLLETITRIEEQQREHQMLIEKLLRVSEANTQQIVHNQQQIHQQQLPQLPMLPQILPHQSQINPSQFMLPQLEPLKQFVEVLPGSNSENCSAGQDGNSEDTEFDRAFRNFFKVYNNLTAEDKPMKIRKLVRNSSQRDTEKISEFLDMFLTEGLQRIPPIDIVLQKNSPCECSSCPFQKELQNIEEFYDDFLSLPQDPNQHLVGL